MAAATIDAAETLCVTPFLIRRLQLSSLTSDQNEDVAHGGPSTVSPAFVIPLVSGGATDGSQVTGEWIKASDSTDNNTVRVKFRVAQDGDIAGAKGCVLVVFVAQAQGGLSV